MAAVIKIKLKIFELINKADFHSTTPILSALVVIQLWMVSLWLGRRASESFLTDLAIWCKFDFTLSVKWY